MQNDAHTKQSVVDELLDRYLSWREESVALDTAYERWARSARPDRPAAFAAYRAQLELEEHAARCYEECTCAARAQDADAAWPVAA